MRCRWNRYTSRHLGRCDVSLIISFNGCVCGSFPLVRGRLPVLRTSSLLRHVGIAAVAKWTALEQSCQVSWHEVKGEKL